MMPGFRERIRAEIQKALQSDYYFIIKLRNQEKRNQKWAGWSEDERNDRLRTVTREWAEARKSSGKHISCRFEIFTDYVPQFLGARVKDPEKQELIHEQIRVRGQEPIEEGEQGQDDDEDDEELVPTHLMAKSERSGERELNDIEPYAAAAEAEDKSDDENQDDNGNSKSESEDEDDDDDDEAECLESDDEDDHTQPQTAIILGHPLPLPTPPSQLTKPLPALKQFYRTPSSLASTEKAVLLGPLDVVHRDGMEWEWKGGERKRGIDDGENGEGGRGAWRKRAKVEGLKSGVKVKVKVERKGGLA